MGADMSERAVRLSASGETLPITVGRLSASGDQEIIFFCIFAIRNKTKVIMESVLGKDITMQEIVDEVNAGKKINLEK